MNKGLLIAASMLSVGGIAASASAAPVTLDDFSSGGNQMVNQLAPLSDNGIRGLRIYNIEQGGEPGFGNEDPNAIVLVGRSRLSISNGADDDSTVDLTYQIQDASLDFTSEIILNFMNNDNALPEASQVEAFIGGTSLGVQALMDSNTPFSLSFAVSRAEAALLASGTELKFTFNGSPEYDLALDSVATQVPEPGMLGLMGLGLIGIAAANRRRKAR